MRIDEESYTDATSGSESGISKTSKTSRTSKTSSRGSARHLSPSGSRANSTKSQSQSSRGRTPSLSNGPDSIFFKRTLEVLAERPSNMNPDFFSQRPSDRSSAFSSNFEGFVSAVTSSTALLLSGAKNVLSRVVSSGYYYINEIRPRMALNYPEGGYPPWVGCPNEEMVKDHCLQLSTNKWNLVNGPPDESYFDFDFNTSYQDAMAVIREDPNLRMLRHELVPNMLDEETFWRNYFYRVSLVCRANDLLCIADEDFCKQATLNQPRRKRF